MNVLSPAAEVLADGNIVARARATEFRLAAGIFSRDMGRMWRAVDAIGSRKVGINKDLIANEVPPFGGMKTIGLGGGGSKYGIEEFLDQQYVLISRNGSSRGETQ